ncbi:TolC family protein [Leptospira sp. GIMC2001]|uniref:TolC family protein n=1 Tax=Leptospira sp. GIMC2001 TaxID=1513297 RepID=UPI0004A5C456|nr:TolC family protein [Leptospira sp. GIMC2001]AID56181.1 heavy metal RND efflux outer membrane protein [Leptospira sp. GIMC2001]WCL50038.1 TolC family protein [Leptospira sp. GIMC2001]
MQKTNIYISITKYQIYTQRFISNLFKIPKFLGQNLNRSSKFLILFYLFLFAFHGNVRADEKFEVVGCDGKISIFRIVQCVLNHSPEYKIGKYEIESSAGRKEIASYLFPTNPNFSFSSGMRNGSSGNSFGNSSQQSALNSEVLISQEIFVGGQRQIRINIADTELRSRIKRLLVLEKFIIGDAVSLSLAYLSSQEEYDVTDELYKLSLEIYNISKTRFKNGLGTEMDMEIAESEKLKMMSLWNSAKRKTDDLKADLTVMMGTKFTKSLDIIKTKAIYQIPLNDLESYTARSEAQRYDLEVLELERELSEKRIRLLEREKIPNLTISGYAQNDGFNEQVIGGRVSIPLRIWRDNRGEIKEAIAESKKRQADQEIGYHTVRSESIKAWNNYKSWKEVWTNYPEDILIRTNENLNILKNAVLSGQISVREALVTQRSLIELKSSYFQSKSGYAQACIEYLRASGEDMLPLLSQEKFYE